MTVTTPIPITLVGATGLTGSATLNSLLQSPLIPFNITTIARKAISASTSKNAATTYTHNLISDLFEAPKDQVASKGGVYVSCLGTTRGTAGSLDAQRKIDLDLNRDLATKAKEDGAETMILVSSGMASSSSSFPYTKMKGQLEDAVKDMGFKHCVILRPGLLMGQREELRAPEYGSQVIFRGLRGVGLPMDRFMTDAEDVGDCIASFAAKPPSEPFSIIDSAKIVATAKQWRSENASKAP